MNPIRRLHELGQSVWLDYVDRKLLTSGELDRLIINDGLGGITSNPTIFQKAIAGSSDYDDAIARAPASETTERVLERLMVKDLALACDKLRTVYDTSRGTDGFASIEVAPGAANDSARTIAEATRLWCAVDRPNLMVKIPGTRAGLAAIRECLGRGINVNITLLFSVTRYREVLEAYLGALEGRAARHEAIDRVASVASFFVSRVDAKVDKALDELPAGTREAGRSLRGAIGIANATLAHEHYEQICATDRWRELAERGAHPQRLLWASTSPKDPAYRDLHYAEALVGPDTVDTMTPETLRAYRDHGEPVARLRTERDEAHARLAHLAKLGIDLTKITDTLEEEGIASFAESHARTLKDIAAKRHA